MMIRPQAYGVAHRTPAPFALSLKRCLLGVRGGSKAFGVIRNLEMFSFARSLAPFLPKAATMCPLTISRVARCHCLHPITKRRDMPAALQESDLIFPSAASNISSTLGELKRSNLSITNRLRSISQDAEFVQEVARAYRLPLIANERCGSWYIPPADKAGSAYFKSTDGHHGQWAFSLRRLNLQVLDVVGEHGGYVGYTTANVSYLIYSLVVSSLTLHVVVRACQMRSRRLCLFG